MRGGKATSLCGKNSVFNSFIENHTNVEQELQIGCTKNPVGAFKNEHGGGNIKIRLF